MPEELQTIFLWITALGAAAVLMVAIRRAVTHRTITPVFLALAAFAAIAMETIVAFLGHVTHADVNAMTLFSAVDRVIPWHIALGYMMAFGALFLTIYVKAADGKLTRRFVLMTGIVMVPLYQLFEIVGVFGGMWRYFEPQPLWLWHGTAPITWSVLNTGSELFAISLTIFLLPHLRGWRKIAIIPLGPTGAIMGHLGAGWPMYNMINSKASPLAMQLSGVAAIILSIFLWWVAAILATTPAADAIEGGKSGAGS